MPNLTSPLPWQDFLARFWEHEPLLIKRGNAQFYQDVLPDIPTVLALDWARHNVQISRLLKTGVERVMRNPEGVLSDLFHDGYTIIIKNADDKSAVLAHLRQELRTQLQPRIFCNLFITPPHAQGFPPHWDDHDVFALQLWGTKTWRMYPPTVELPLSESPALTTVPPLYAEYVVEQGDLLYFPRGWIHEARTGQDASAHVTVWVQPDRWVNVLADALLVAALKEVTLRKSVPLSHNIDELHVPLQTAVAALFEQDRWLEGLESFHARRSC